MSRKCKKWFSIAIVISLLPAFSCSMPAQPELMSGQIRLIETFGNMGLWMIPINEEFAQRFGVTVDSGLLVAPLPIPLEYVDFSPSELHAWDIVVKCGGKDVADMSDIIPTDDGKEIDLIVLRDGKLINVTIHLADESDMEGLIMRSSEMEEESSSHSFPEREIEKTVYYQEGEYIWDGPHTLLEGGGEAAITGRLIISGKPAEGVEVSLFLTGKKRTQSALTNSEGRFEIPIQPGKYFYIGYALSGSGVPDRNMVAVDKNLTPYMGRKTGSPQGDCDEVMDRFQELESKYGPEQAAEMIAEEFETDLENPFTEKYPLKVGPRESASIPDIIFNDPIRIVTPLNNTRVSMDRLSFAWIPFDGADSYLVKVCNIQKKGRSTHYTPVCEGTAYDNSLTAEELECESARFLGDDDRVDGLVSGERYGLKVYAFDREGKLLTASSEHNYVEFYVK